MIQEHVLGTIQDVREDGQVVITAGLPSLDRALLREYKQVEIILPDGRRGRVYSKVPLRAGQARRAAMPEVETKKVR